MKKIYWIPLLILTITIFGFQMEDTTPSVILEGIVTEASGEPLIGASVILKGTKNATSTDINGRYSLKIEGVGPHTFVFSYTGFTTIEKRIFGSSLVN